MPDPIEPNLNRRSQRPILKLFVQVVEGILSATDIARWSMLPPDLPRPPVPDLA